MLIKIYKIPSQFSIEETEKRLRGFILDVNRYNRKKRFWGSLIPFTGKYNGLKFRFESTYTNSRSLMTLETAGKINKTDVHCEIELVSRIPPEGFIGTVVIFLIVFIVMNLKETVKDPIMPVFVLGSIYLMMFLMCCALVSCNGQEYRTLIKRIINPHENFSINQYIEEKKSDQWKLLATVVIGLIIGGYLCWYVVSKY